MPIPDPTFQGARRGHRAFLALPLSAALLVACSSGPSDGGATTSTAGGRVTSTTAGAATTGGGATSVGAGSTAATTVTPTSGAPGVGTTTAARVVTIAGMPGVPDPTRIYSEAGAGMFSPAVADAKRYVYVPSNDAGSVTVIDQDTYEIVRTFSTGGKLVQHVVPGYDLKTLYANVSGSNFLRAIDPTTGEPGERIPVDAPYNLYFTPDGTRAIVMAERLDRIDFYDRATWKPLERVTVPCESKFRDISFGGVNHADWSTDGSYFLATCEFAGRMLKVDTTSMAVIGELDLPGEMPSMPQDVRTPDGRTFYVADMMNGGVWVVDGPTMTITTRIATGVGAHGIYPSRDGTKLYVANRGRMKGEEGRRSKPGDGSVSVIDWKTNTVVATWPVEGGGSPDMGGVSADGTKLWLAGRYDSEVYVFDTVTGALVARIGVPRSPHGLAVWPQPGRYSLGHTGNTR